MPTQLEEALARPLRKSYDEWTFFGKTANGQTPLRILVRQFLLTTDALRQSAVDALSAVTQITDPVASGITYSGTWRAVKVWAGKYSDPDGGTIYQTLVQGEFIDDRYQTAEDADSETFVTPYYMVDTVPDLPANADGYTATLEGFNFDRETGTYSGAIVERYAKKLELPNPITDTVLSLTDVNGEKTLYDGDNLTLDEVVELLTQDFSTVNASFTCDNSPTYPGRYSLNLRTSPDNGTTPTNNAAYDLIGEFFEPWQDRSTQKEFARVTLYTRSKTEAQQYMWGQCPGRDYGLISQVDVKVVSGIKTNWGAGNSYVVETGISRNRGNGRYVAMRTQMKAT